MDETIQQIAARLRGLREVLELSVQQMANDCHLDAEVYQKYENGLSDIPVGVLYVIANKYGIELTALLTGDEPRMHTYSITRKMQGDVVDRNSAYNYRALAQSYINRKASPFLVTVEPKDASEPIHLNSHQGQEFDYILKGRLKLLFNGKEMILEEGDSIYFNSALPHGMVALDEKECQFLAVIF